MRRELFSGLVLMAMMFAACSDDLGHSPKYDDGFLHFNLLFNSSPESCWKEDGSNGSGTRCEAPLELTSPDLPGLKLYLHTEISDQIDPPAPVAEPASSNDETRGQRYTSDVFNGTNHIGSLSIYGEIDGSTISGMNFATINRDDTERLDAEDEYSWRKNDFTIDQYWPEGKKGNFYAFAPAPTEATGLSTGLKDSNPLHPQLTYAMPTAEADHKDVLRAKAENVGRFEDVNLEFSHILSAVRFKLADGDLNGIYECKVKTDGGTVVKTFKIVVKQIDVKNVYKTGTCDLWENTTAWTNDGTKGNCTITIDADMQTAFENNTPHFFNDDDHCLMMLPQSLPSDAKVEFTCDLYEGTETTPSKTDIVFSTSLNGKTWEPNHSYKYSLSDQELLYVLETSLSEDKKFPLMGTDAESVSSDEERKKAFTVKSYYYDQNNSNPNGLAADWIPQWSTDGSSWTDGLPDGFYLEDSNGDALDDDEIEQGIKGSVAEKTYYLCAMFRSENSPTIPLLRQKRYKDDTHGVTTTSVLKSNVGVTYDANGYYDLSYQLDANNRNTANCYIVDGYGKFKFPLVYGNAITNGTTFAKAYTIYQNTNANNWTQTDTRTFVDYNGTQIASPYIWETPGVTPGQMTPYIVWQDSKDMILHDYDKVRIAKEDDDIWYMYFEIAKSKITSGNAILAVKDGNGVIMWSWHIWVTPLNYSNTINVYDNASPRHEVDFTRYNLGWREGEETSYPDLRTVYIRSKQIDSDIIGKDKTVPSKQSYTVTQASGTVTIGGSNLYYQNGRKDPMPAQYAKKNGTGVTGVDMANQFKAFYAAADPRHYDWSVVELNNANKIPVETTIQNPDKLYPAGAGDFIRSERLHGEAVYSGIYNGGRWDPQKAYNTSCKSSYAHVKTVHDPSPAGYTVPPYAAYDIMSVWAYNFSNNNGGTRDKANLRGKILKHLSTDSDENGITFWATGERHQGDGHVTDFNTEGRYWTAGIGGSNAHNNGDGHYLQINPTNNTIPLHANTSTGEYCRNHSYPVIAVKENTWDYMP